MQAREREKDTCVYELVRAFLFDWLRSGAWSTGAQLPDETQLAQHFGTDVTSVRDAVARLGVEHLFAGVRADGSMQLPQPLAIQNSAAGGRKEFAQVLQRFLNWASDEALEVLYDDVVAKHLAAASDRLTSRFG